MRYFSVLTPNEALYRGGPYILFGAFLTCDTLGLNMGLRRHKLERTSVILRPFARSKETGSHDVFSFLYHMFVDGPNVLSYFRPALGQPAI